MAWGLAILSNSASLFIAVGSGKNHITLYYTSKANNAPWLPSDSTSNPVTSNAPAELTSKSLLMICRILVNAPHGSSVEAWAILESASVSECLAQTLCLSRPHQSTRISGVAGLSHNSSLQSVASFKIFSTRLPSKKIDVTAVIAPRVTCDLPLHPIPFDPTWNHFPLADPDFGCPGRINILLGVDVVVETLGRRIEPPGSPIAFETDFGWVLAGQLDSCTPDHHIVSHHVSFIAGDDPLCRFWEIEENPKNEVGLTPEERSVVQHFKDNHYRTERFVPLPRKPHAKPLGESRSQAVRCFLALEC